MDTSHAQLYDVTTSVYDSNGYSPDRTHDMMAFSTTPENDDFVSQSQTVHGVTENADISTHHVTDYGNVSQHDATKYADVSTYDVIENADISSHDVTENANISPHDVTEYANIFPHEVTEYANTSPHDVTQYTTGYHQDTSGFTSMFRDTSSFSITEHTNSTNETSDYGYYYYDYSYNERLIDAQDRRIYTRFYMLGIILPIGILFNLFAFIVFMRSPNINRTTTGRFLIALTMADTLFLIGDFLRWLNTADTKGQILGIEFAEEYLVWCALIYSMRYYGQLVSSWLTVAITVERFIGVAFPLKASQICTKTKTNIVISIIWLLSIGLSCFPFWTLRINSAYGIKWCEYKNQEEFDRWSWAIIRIMSLILPSIIIFVFTGLIIYKLQKITRNRAEMSRLTRKGKKQTLERQLTIMLIAVSVTFLILRLPYVITYYMFDFRHDFWGEEIGVWFEYRLWLARDICDVFATANYAINFFLYCLTGSQFRSNIKSCIRCESVRAIRLKKYRSTFRSNTALTVHNSNHSSNSSLNGISNGALPNTVNLQSNGVRNGTTSNSNGVSKRTSVSIV